MSNLHGRVAADSQASWLREATERQLVRDALAWFDLAPTRVALLRHTNNVVYSVEAAGEQSVLRLHRAGHRTPSHTRDELTLLEAIAPRLALLGVDVPRPVRSTSGDLVAEVAGNDTTHASVLTWVGGASLRPGDGLGLAGARLLGEALAHLHEVTASTAQDLGLVLFSWDARSMFTEESPFRPGSLDDVIPGRHREVFDAGVHRATAAFEELDSVRDHPRGVIHFDFILLNCRLQRGRHWRAGVIDFDDVGSGHCVYDLAPLIGNLLDFPEGARLARAFCFGYEAVRRLPPGWPAVLAALMGGRQIVSALWAAGMGRRTGNSERAAELVDIRMQQLRRYTDPRSAASVAAALSR